jgi:3-oxoacyl-[acyl-carrier protein] reductase
MIGGSVPQQASMIGRPADIAATVSFLAGPDGAWINAQVIRPNGGFA